MINALLALVAAAGLYTIYLALLVNAASPQVIVAYIAASIGALIASKIARPWASTIRWAWIAVSLAVIFAVVTGPLDYLRLPT